MNLLHEQLVELMWSLFDRQSYDAARTEEARRRAPAGAIKSDSLPQTLEQKLIARHPGYMGAFFQRGDDVQKSFQEGPATGAQLDQLIMDFMRQSHELKIKNTNRDLL